MSHHLSGKMLWIAKKIPSTEAVAEANQDGLR
jgi:hypothetical protein